MAAADDDPMLPIQRALDVGDLREARRLADALAADASASDEMRKRARGVQAQLATDPVIVGVMVATGTVIVALAIMYLRAHG